MNAKKPLISSGAFTMNSRYHFMMSAAWSISHSIGPAQTVCTGCAWNRNDVHVLHRRKVDHQPVVTNAQPTRVVSAAAHGDPQPGFPPEGEGGDYVRHVRAFGDQARLAADHRVVDFARVLIGRVGGLDQ